LSILEPAAVQQRRPGAQKIHRHGLHSLGPNEEWSVDGHDKIRNAMRLDVWGVVDKYSRLVLGHFVVPNNRLADTVLACFILLVKRVGGTCQSLLPGTVTNLCRYPSPSCR
jgi:transposase InsO family protein